jgi:hypothetical protein
LGGKGSAVSKGAQTESRRFLILGEENHIKFIS